MGTLYTILADIIKFIHFLYIIFVVGGQIVIVVGLFRKWPFVRNLVFRLTHLIAILIVSFQEIVGLPCPLTVLEDYLNKRAGRPYSGDLTFIGRILDRLIYHDIPDWIFTLMYVGFGGLVLVTIIAFPPYFKKRKE
jgi:hypothetical protein